MNDLSAFDGDGERERQICNSSGEGQDGGRGRGAEKNRRINPMHTRMWPRARASLRWFAASGIGAIAGIAGNAHPAESEPASVAALIREWRTLEAACRGSNDPAACDKLNSVGEELGQKGLCFNGYGSGRRWVRC